MRGVISNDFRGYLLSLSGNQFPHSSRLIPFNPKIFIPPTYLNFKVPVYLHLAISSLNRNFRFRKLLTTISGFPVLHDSFPLQWRLKSGNYITLMDVPTSNAAIYFMYSHL
jgi:hypothetical protein